MSERRSDRVLSVLFSILIHAAIVGVLVWGWWQYKMPKPAPQTLAIEATVVHDAPPAAPPAPPAPPPVDPQAQQAAIEQQQREQAEKEAAAKAEAEHKATREQIVGLRRTVFEYHSSVIGHGMLISELEARLRRVEKHLDLPPVDAF